jgi:hypothetical protein
MVGKRGVIPLFCASGDWPENSRRPDVYFDVHGSLTYSDNDPKYPVENKEIWWFGFDAGHSRDNEEGGRSLDYMIAECESLARQIDEVRKMHESSGINCQRLDKEWHFVP